MALIRRFSSRLSTVTRFLSQVGQIAERYKTSRSKILWRAGWLNSKKGIALQEGLLAGLLAPNVSKQTLDVCLSKSNLQRLQAKINPRKSECLTEDKAIFYPFCEGLSLRAPSLYAVIDKYQGWTRDGQILTERSAWERFIDKQLPQEFVVKPATGAYGDEVMIYARNGSGFLDTNGHEFSATQILDSISSSSRYSKFLISERLRGHPDLELLSNTPYLQTVRLVTFVDEKQQSDIYLAYLRVIAGDHPVDNINKGAYGNLISPVDLQSGGLSPGVRIAPDRFGYVILNCHPRTGKVFEGHTIPMWKEACDLVRKASVLFLPLRTIGWDVGITPDSPVLVEGNAYYDNFLRYTATANEKHLLKVGNLIDRLENAAREKSKKIKSRKNSL